ncbi:MAG: hypothetical protein HY681_09170 [Chloroflexi bacterium]|nr:hypothetical protein [Chloroflexota bacterium]
MTSENVPDQPTQVAQQHSELRRQVQLLALLLFVTSVASVAPLPVATRSAIHEIRGGIGTTDFGVMMSVGSLVALVSGIAAAIYVDRRGPRWLLPPVGLAIALASATLLVADSLWMLILSSAASGVATGLLSAAVLVGVVVRGCHRIPGAAIGALLGLPGLAQLTVGIFPDDAWRALSATSLVLGLVAAVALILLLPRLYAPTTLGWTQPLWRRIGSPDAATPSGIESPHANFRKSLLLLGAVFLLSQAVSFSAQWVNLSANAFTPRGMGSLWPYAVVFGALLWGIAGDRWDARRLFIALAGLGIAALAVMALPFGITSPESDYAAALGTVMLGLAAGGVKVLPWVLLADTLGTRRIATWGVLLFTVGGQFGGLLASGALTLGGAHLALMVSALLLAFVAHRTPVPGERATKEA